MKPTLFHALAVAVALGAAVAVAEPRVTQDGSVTWVAGGVTGDERAELVLQLPDYNLRLLTAAQKSGNYLSDVALTIRDAKGEHSSLPAFAQGCLQVLLLSPCTFFIISSTSTRSSISSFNKAPARASRI